MEKYLKLNVFGIIGATLAAAALHFSIWRSLESELNSNVRESSFSILKETSVLQSLILKSDYHGNYGDKLPSSGYATVIFIRDLGILVSPDVESSTEQLHKIWVSEVLINDKFNRDIILSSITEVRHDVLVELKNIQ